MDKSKPSIQFQDLNTGEIIFERWFTPAQVEFWNSTSRYQVLNGGYGSGKTEPLILKTIYDAISHPDNYILMGRKTYQEIYDVLLKDFLDICPQSFIKKFTKSPHPSIELYCPNSDKTSTIIFRNLDKLAETEIKGLNLGGIAIDQAEEIPENTFRALNFRLRRKSGTRRVYMTVNPLLNWIYKEAKKNPDENKRKEWHVIEAPSTQNYHNLPEETVKIYESYKYSDPGYYRQYVLGVWDESLLAENTVFSRDHILRLKGNIKEPIRIFEDLNIYKEPVKGHRYQMGIDCAEGKKDGDFSAVSIVDLTTLEEVASWAARIPPEAVAERAVVWAGLYNEGYPGCLIVPEINAMGFALLNKLKELGYSRIYQRETFDKRTGQKVEQLGWRTTVQTKPLLMANFRHLLRHFDPQVYTKDTIDEMQSFVYSDEVNKKGAGAEEGYHDDRVMATLLAFWEKTRRDPSAKISREQDRITSRLEKGEQNIKIPGLEIEPSFTVVNGKMKMRNLPKELTFRDWRTT